LGLTALAAVGRGLESGTWEGHLNFNDTFGDFRPCKKRGEVWWVKSPGYDEETPELRQQHDEVTEYSWEKSFARLRGQITRNGQYGPLGTYTRVLYVEEILEVRPRDAEDC
jgi:hypothetical protein